MTYTKLVLSGPYRETEKQVKGVLSAAGSEGFRFDRFYLATDAIIRRKNIDTLLVIFRPDFSPGPAGGLEEIRSRLEAVAGSGKKVVFYASSYSAAELYLASACGSRIIHPLGSLRLSGLSVSFSFYKRIMRRLGVEAEIFRRGRFKSAGDRFRSDGMDEALREQYSEYLEEVDSILRAGISAGYGKGGGEIDALAGGEVLTAEDAEAAGWIDRICTESELLGEWKEKKHKEIKLKDSVNRTGRGLRALRGRLAVLVFEGAVVDGRNRRDPMLGQAVGDVSFIAQIKKLADDKKVKAVVLRINSGGGSAFASAGITAELRILAEKKPLVVSMAGVAGSGGYWLSCCGRKTFALPATLTGSIGVISIYFSWYRLLDRLGITHGTLKTAEFADLGSPLREMSEKEKEMIDREIGTMYDSFVSMVSDFRKMEPASVEAAAEGRVWSGKSALKLGLVDASGGLDAAVAEAAAAAGMKRPYLKFYPEVHRSFIERMLASSSREEESILSEGSRIEAAANFVLGLEASAPGAEYLSKPLAIIEQLLPIS